VKNLPPNEHKIKVEQYCAERKKRIITLTEKENELEKEKI